jgi:hypothetical protein
MAVRNGRPFGALSGRDREGTSPLRDFILCAIIVTIVSSGTTVAQRYVASLQHNATSEHAEALPFVGAEPDCEPVLFIAEPALILRAAPSDLSTKAEPRLLLGQPSPTAPNAIASKPEKKMVGPDGVIFTRSATTSQRTTADGPR